MSNNTINVDLNLRSNINQGTRDAQGLNSQLSEATRNLIAYNRAAAIGGGSARDFGKEAEGLGGVVRSYAIVAANVYAVTAAMKVLSDAMDTSIMVKSMDILGARSGMALGSLAKELVKASDGALSLRESLEVVSKGTTAGMTSGQLKDLTKVAGNASRALGLNMTDAMSRLIRGTSKLEPELLDELGLFTKIEPAVNEYARSLGKSASNLTDFERRQAFLTATLKEGEEKYGDLAEAGTNAYTKLAAVFKNTLQTTLEKINDLLLPIINLLSSNPTAFYAVLAGIGALLLKQLIPALGQFNAGLQRSLDAASITAIDRVNRVQKAISDRQTAARAQAIEASESEANARVAAIDRVEKKLKSIQNRGGTLTPGVQEVVSQTTPATDITAERAKQLRQEVRASGQAKQDRRVQYEYIKTLEQSRIAEETHAAAVQARQNAILAAQRASATLKAEEILQNRAVQKSVDQLNLRNVATNTQELGFIEAIRRGREDIRERRAGPTTREIPTGQFDETGGALTRTVTAARLNPIVAGFQTIKVGAVAATRAVSTFLAVASPYLMVFTLLAPAIGLLHDKFVGNIKDIEATNEAYDKLQEGIKNAYRTIEFLGKNSTKLLSVENLNAAATALQGIGNELEDFTRKAQRELASGSTYYRGVENIQNFFGFGTEKSISKALLSSFDAAVQLSITDSEPMRKELAKILQLPEDATFASIRLKASQADAGTQMKFAQGLKQVGTNAKAAVQPTKQLIDNLTQTAKVFDNIITSVLPSTGLAKWAYEGVINMQSFRKEIGNAATDIGALNEIVKAPGELIKKFGIEGSKAIIPLIPEIKRLNEGYAETVNKLAEVERATTADTDKELAMARERVKRLRESEEKKPSETFQSKEELRQAEERLDRLIKFKDDKLAASATRQGLLGTKAQQEQSIRTLFNQFDKISTDSAIAFSKQFEIELGSSIAKARLSVQKALTSYVEDPEVKAELEYRDTMQGIKLEQQKITSTYNLITAIENNSIQLAKTALVYKETATAEMKEGPDKTRQQQSIEAERQAIDLREQQNKAKDPGKFFRNLMASEAALTRGELLAQERLKTEQSQQAAEGVTPAAAISGPSAKLQAMRSAITTGASVVAQKQATAAAGEELKAQQKIAQIKLKIDKDIKASFTNVTKNLEFEITGLQQKKKIVEGTVQSEIERMRSVNELDDQILVKENEKKLLQEGQSLAIAAQLQVENKFNAESGKNYQRAVNIYLTTKNQLEAGRTITRDEAERKVILKELDEKYKEINHKLQLKSVLLEANRKLEDAGIESAKLKLDAEISIGKYTPQQIQNKRAAQALDEANLTMVRDLQNAEKSRNEQREKYTEEYSKAALTYGEDSPEARRAVENLNTAEQSYGLTYQAIVKLNEAKKESIAITNSLSVQEKGFADIFTKGFESMADAMAEFVKTGKMDFKGLINSMIMDLIRFQLRSQMQELAGPGGGANFFAKLLSGALNRDGGMPNFAGDYSEDLSGPQAYFGGSTVNALEAKGSAYDSGVKKFAMGGAFTNSIVNSPTLFKFANGTGLMGEAGPEAIMPLKRDASGTLGVRAPGGQGKVDIVVNNYSGQKTETKETTDSRGNRKVEVVVGEMSGGDISKPGSSSQQALRSNYGLQPALIRR